MVDQEKNCFLENKQTCSKDGGKYGLAKKIKKATKAPQRGPGVAELEKILREQQMNNDMTVAADRLSCHVNPSSSPYLPPPPRPPPSSDTSPSPKFLPTDVHFVKQPDLVCPPLPPRFGNVNSSSHHCPNGFWPSNGRNDNHPSILRPCESNSEGNGPGLEYIVPTMIRSPDLSYATRPSLAVQAQLSTRHYPQPIVRMNLCPSTVPSAKASVQHQPVEHPSNQRSCTNFKPNQPDEEKILVGVKRPWPFSVIIPSSPVPTTSQAEQSNRFCDHSSLHSEHRNKIPRNLNLPTSPKERTEMYFADETALDGKLLKLGPPVSPSLWMQSRAKEAIVISDSSLPVSHFGYHSESVPNNFSTFFGLTWPIGLANPMQNDGLEEQCRDSDLYGSVDQPLYNFIPPDKFIRGRETILSLRHGRDEVRVQKVDLDLRL